MGNDVDTQIKQITGWNISTTKYFTPTEMRNDGNSSSIDMSIFSSGTSDDLVSKYLNTQNSFGNYGGTGVDGIFNTPLSLCAEIDACIELTKPLILAQQKQGVNDRWTNLMESILSVLTSTDDEGTGDDGTDDPPGNNTTPPTDTPAVKKRTNRSLRSR